jgi:hypothetical protein
MAAPRVQIIYFVSPRLACASLQMPIFSRANHEQKQVGSTGRTMGTRNSGDCTSIGRISIRPNLCSYKFATVDDDSRQKQIKLAGNGSGSLPTMWLINHQSI